MISAYHAYLIDPEIHRLDLEADRAQHRADLAGLTSLFSLIAPIKSANSAAQSGGSHLGALVSAVAALHFAIKADEHAHEMDKLLDQRQAYLRAQVGAAQPLPVNA